MAFIDGSIEALASGKIEEPRFKDALSAFRYGLSMQIETPADIAVSLAVTTGLTGDVNTLDRLGEEVAALKSSDLARRPFIAGATPSQSSSASERPSNVSLEWAAAYRRNDLQWCRADSEASCPGPRSCA